LACPRIEVSNDRHAVGNDQDVDTAFIERRFERLADPYSGSAASAVDKKLIGLRENMRVVVKADHLIED
jgi:hypothetical protein